MFRLELFWLALGFYTRLPCPQSVDYSRLPLSAVYLPLIGWLVGATTGLGFYLGDLLWGQVVAVVLALIIGILSTGAFHEDGFADVCDGFGGGYSKARILEIMKDSRIGAYGALGIIMIMTLKISILAELPAISVPFIFFAGHSVSRLPPLFLMYQYDYARTEDSKSHAAVFKPNVNHLLFAGIFAGIPVLFLPMTYALAIPVVIAVNCYLGHYFYKHIGGYTGDCLGASQQVAETIFYLSVLALWKFT